MLAEIIAIGDELTSGQRLDTNSQWLSERLGEIGVHVLYHTTVADDLAANVRVFREAIERADLVVTTGGLGPTADDLTRDALAAATGTELLLDAGSLEHIEKLFQRRGREMPERNRVQALFPAGSRPIPNPEGTAPGIALEIVRPQRPLCRVYALPGVPAEMKQMWEGTVRDAIGRASATPRVIRHRRIKCFGVGESRLEAMLPDLIRRGRDPSVGITVHEGTITLRITAAGATTDECLERMEPTVAVIRNSLGALVFGEEDDELEDAVVELLGRLGRSLATVECGTAGLVAERLGRVSEVHGRFLGGMVLHDLALAQRWFALDSSLLTPPRMHEAEFVEALARQAREACGADFLLVVGPYPPRNPQGAEPPAFHFAVASRQAVELGQTPFGAHSAILRSLSAKQGLNHLRLVLLKLLGK